MNIRDILKLLEGQSPLSLTDDKPRTRLREYMETVEKEVMETSGSGLWVVIGNAGRYRQTLWPGTSKPEAYSEEEAKAIAKKMNDGYSDTTYGVQPTMIHWYAHPLETAASRVHDKPKWALQDLAAKHGLSESPIDEARAPAPLTLDKVASKVLPRGAELNYGDYYYSKNSGLASVCKTRDKIVERLKAMGFTMDSEDFGYDSKYEAKWTMGRFVVNISSGASMGYKYAGLEVSLRETDAPEASVSEDLVDMTQPPEDHTLSPEHIRSIEQHLDDYLAPYGGGAEVLSVEKAENGWMIYCAFESSLRFEVKEKLNITGRPTNSGRFEDFQVIE